MKEWKALDATMREQFRKKLRKRYETPHIPAAKLHGAKDRYKVKLRQAGYRLVYEVRNDRLVVLVIAVGRHDRSAIYAIAKSR